jgi:lysophospholipase L1-like esterase/pimeloyl-ACP methyl ester carboxylesterase
MKIKSVIVLFLLFTFLHLSSTADIKGSDRSQTPTPIKIACIGNSITNGYGITDRESKSYPGQLQSLLGNDYEVTNYGVNGATLIHNGAMPYIRTDAFHKALESNPDIVFIMLGTNDSKIKDSVLRQTFEQDYTEFVQCFKQLPTNPRVILLTPVACFITEAGSLSDSIIVNKIIPGIQQVAYKLNLELINLHNLFVDQPGLFFDKLHPTAEGATLIANRVFKLIKQSADTAFNILPQIPTPQSISSFSGYVCVDFKLNERDCKIVFPKRANSLHLWVWRARFWGHEPQTDIALLERGFHIVYCDVAELFGNAMAIRYWNQFYDWLQEAGFAKKTVLEGMSRGGVYIYNWAAVNPEKIACIYADNPVLDLRSWPGGKGRDTDSKNEWEEFKKDYGFKSDAEAMKFSGSPINKVKEIAAGGYPMLHVCGDADEVVPMKENTEPFARQIIALKGNITVIDKPGVGHHPHSLPNPTLIVDFILRSFGK